MWQPCHVYMYHCMFMHDHVLMNMINLIFDRVKVISKFQNTLCCRGNCEKILTRDESEGFVESLGAGCASCCASPSMIWWFGNVRKPWKVFTSRFRARLNFRLVTVSSRCALSSSHSQSRYQSRSSDDLEKFYSFTLFNRFTEILTILYHKILLKSWLDIPGT